MPVTSRSRQARQHAVTLMAVPPLPTIAPASGRRQGPIARAPGDLGPAHRHGRTSLASPRAVSAGCSQLIRTVSPDQRHSGRPDRTERTWRTTRKQATDPYTDSYTQNSQICTAFAMTGIGPTRAQNGGSVRVLRGSRGHAVCCRSPASLFVDPALTAPWPQHRSSGLHGPALPDIDFRNRASPNFSSNFMSESESTGFVDDLIRLQAETAGDDLLLDLGGAAEARPPTRESAPLSIGRGWLRTENTLTSLRFNR